MRLASYNVENLFRRARALSQDTWAEGREVLTQFATLNRIFDKEKYTKADKARIVDLMAALGIEKADEGPFVILRQNKGKLVKRPKSGGVEVVANGRGDWVGWLDLKVDDVNDVATLNTARVIREVNPDILSVVEVEDRPALMKLSDYLLPTVDGKAFDHAMVIDGNDTRSIDVGIVLRKKFQIERMRSHVDDVANKERIFSRDCPEYWLQTPNGERLVILVNHLKSKGFGTKKASDDKRKRQAKRVAEIYREVVSQGVKYVAVVGDFNDTPDSAALAPLLTRTNLRDISTHRAFDDGGRPGTFGNGAPSNKIDYILLSPALFAKTKGGGIYRQGVWGGKSGDLFPHLPEITKSAEAASDHALIWADIDI